MKKKETIQRSEPVQEILGTIPPWIIRRGITLFLVIILVLLAGSWFFKYPDFLNAEIEVLTQNPPADVVARASGKLEALFIEDNSHVEKGTRIAVIENPANHIQVFDLGTILQTLKAPVYKTFIDTLPFFEYAGLNALGEIQPFFSVFLKNYLDYQNYLKVNYYSRKIEALRIQIKDHRIYYEYLYRQRNTLEEDYRLAEKDYKRHEQLFRNGAIAEAELEKKESEMLQKKHDFEEARTNLATTQIKITELEEDILEFQLQQQQESSRLQLDLRESYENLYSRVQTWNQTYVIMAPISGRVTFNKYWAENQNITLGDRVVSVVPVDSANIIGKMYVPIQGSGKVKTGQKVNIRFYNFPYMEFGMVEGRISNISGVPADNEYLVEVGFPEGLKTNYGITLEFNQMMKGSAEIITEDIRLLVRIIRPLRSLIQNRSFREVSPETVSNKNNR
ncbi:MAG: HlyD family secretion protein [Bacteroidetes bacterium]|nr:HlyD family secretion protein [Bacteroidota bacterium]